MAPQAIAAVVVHVTPAERAEILRTFPSAEYPELDLLPLLVELRETGGRAATKAEAAIRWLLDRRETDLANAEEEACDLIADKEKAEAQERVVLLHHQSQLSFRRRVRLDGGTGLERTPTETEKALAEMTEKYNALNALWEDA